MGLGLSVLFFNFIWRFINGDILLTFYGVYFVNRFWAFGLLSNGLLSSVKSARSQTLTTE
jgi:hypothetical protein